MIDFIKAAWPKPKNKKDISKKFKFKKEEYNTQQGEKKYIYTLVIRQMLSVNSAL